MNRAYKNLLVVFLSIFPNLALSEPDKIILGSATVAANSSVTLPIRIIDSPGTPLGWDAGTGKKIQAFATQIICSPSSAVKSITFQRSGLLEKMLPLYETTKGSGANGAYLVSFDEMFGPIRNLNTPSGAEVARAIVTLSTAAPLGTVITCDLRPATTMLSNQAGTIGESQNNGHLQLTAGTITVAGKAKKPIITISAIGGAAYESPKVATSFQITRAGSLKSSLVVPYQISGSAKNGIDYRKIKSSVTLKKNQASAIVVIVPIFDKLQEKAESIGVVLLPSKSYLLSKQKKVQLIIKDKI